MRYHARLHGMTMGDPLTGLPGGDTPRSRRVALNELAARAGFDTWAQMLEGSPRASKIKLKPLKADLEAYYDSLKGPMTNAQRISIVDLTGKAGINSTNTAAALIGRRNIVGLSRGDASRLIDRLTAGIDQNHRIECEDALRDAYASMAGPVTEKQAEYLLDLADEAGYASLGEAVSAILGGDLSQEMTKGEANFMMDRLKANRYEGDEFSFSGH